MVVEKGTNHGSCVKKKIGKNSRVQASFVFLLSLVLLFRQQLCWQPHSVQEDNNDNSWFPEQQQHLKSNNNSLQEEETASPRQQPGNDFPLSFLTGLPDAQSSSYCGTPWKSFQEHVLPRLPKNNDTATGQPFTFFWTVSGGSTYRRYLPILLNQWKSLGMFPVWVVALDDQETASLACDLGYPSVLWDEPPQTYSRVTDAKFGVAATLARHGLAGLFLALDVFCQTNPLPLVQSLLFQETKPIPHQIGRGEYRYDTARYDLVVLGHGDVELNPNIGMYYVRPTPATAQFLESVLDVLAYSKENDVYVDQKSKRRAFFDQAIFYHCLPSTHPEDKASHMKRAMYLVNDTQKTHDLLRLCKNNDESSPQFHYNVVPSIYINSFNPPIPHDSVYCIHTLGTTALSAFEHKLATAKFLGYDPLPIAAKEQFLKTASGDLLFNECLQTRYRGDQLSTRHAWQENIVQGLATLIWLARETNRTLVMPRQVRDRSSMAALLMSLVDICSVSNLTTYRFWSTQDRLQLGNTRVIVTNNLVQNSHQRLLQDVQASSQDRVVAIASLCKTFGRNRLGQNQSPPHQVVEIAAALKHCMQDKQDDNPTRKVGVDNLHSEAIVNWASLCGSRAPSELLQPPDK